MGGEKIPGTSCGESRSPAAEEVRSRSALELALKNVAERARVLQLVVEAKLESSDLVRAERGDTEGEHAETKLRGSEARAGLRRTAPNPSKAPFALPHTPEKIHTP